MLVSTDFTGYYKIAQDGNSATLLTAYIEKYEKEYLVDLLGYDLYLLFIADLTANVPQTTRFLTIFNELSYNTNSGDVVFIPSEYNDSDYAKRYRQKSKVPTLSTGIIKMLKGFIYFEFVKEYGVQVSQTGVVIGKNENSDTSDSKALGLVESRYNDSINSYKVIQNYINANSEMYPEYEGVNKDKSYWGGAF